MTHIELGLLSGSHFVYFSKICNSTVPCTRVCKFLFLVNFWINWQVVKVSSPSCSILVLLDFLILSGNYISQRSKRKSVNQFGMCRQITTFVSHINICGTFKDICQSKHFTEKSKGTSRLFVFCFFLNFKYCNLQSFYDFQLE